MKTFKLCRDDKCCPVVEITDEKLVVITDDNGGKVELTREQVEILFEQLKIS